MWQAALKRTDIIINTKQAVCHHHFLPTDILWKREICNEKGNVLGEVSCVINCVNCVNYLN